jgi:hypothetical protein
MSGAGLLAVVHEWLWRHAIAVWEPDGLMTLTILVRAIPSRADLSVLLSLRFNGAEQAGQPVPGWELLCLIPAKHLAKPWESQLELSYRPAWQFNERGRRGLGWAIFSNMPNESPRNARSATPVNKRILRRRLSIRLPHGE